ncbi:EAL domain-containing protein [Agrobacterium rubi]|uniref:EAL domain-containing protein n=1 Tax=Agrobacterium rubi TaxID=28099 RepID=A0AAE7R4N8_9HYPH|nr:EAL domain-containing protein [Agrobacterium rubi]NTE86925.1 EAL domain-containing protein [Agrobacterium rubi]NTF02859.1 EAL domain-containing protein [Agrobacterium rubi]NTF37103.1 EAL domain-containing protein [Agrobacterium rubi]OCJ55308.1 diguanylate phosphodiesterase [Agrobacterium rubi]QTF99536.1 EAL domain-containing protein [Agrobacterium rubi]
MAPKSIFSNLMREADGSWSTTYGAFTLKSALQPIFRRLSSGRLDIDSFEGLVRPYQGSELIPPAQLFRQVHGDDIEAIDSILRTIHILNTGALERSRTRIFVNFHPGLFRTPGKMRQEVERMRLSAHEAGMTPDRIVCEIAEKNASDATLVADFADHMRAMGFRVAIADFGAGDSDIERVKLMRPDYVKFEAAWARQFMRNSAGAALLRHIVKQFAKEHIELVFEALEDEQEIELCVDLGVALMQGYALARPELAPTTFNQRFPEFASPSRAAPETKQRLGTGHETPALKPVRTFGKRGI